MSHYNRDGATLNLTARPNTPAQAAAGVFEPSKSAAPTIARLLSVLSDDPQDAPTVQRRADCLADMARSQFICFDAQGLQFCPGGADRAALIDPAGPFTSALAASLRRFGVRPIAVGES